jgi:hypothetical protein
MPGLFKDGEMYHPSPLMGEGWGEGEVLFFPSPLSSPTQGRGLEFVLPSIPFRQGRKLFFRLIVKTLD